MNEESQFIINNEPLIYIALKKYLGNKYYEDLLQEARIWLWEAKKTWNPKRSAWTTYAVHYIFWKYSRYIQNMFLPRKGTLVKGKSNYCVNIEKVERLIGSDENYFTNISEAKIIYEKALNDIKDAKHKKMIQMHLDGYSFYIIARKFNLSHTRIQQIWKMEIDRMKLRLGIK